MPNVTVINNSICFNASSERSVDYYEVSITDVTDLDTPLSGIYTTSQCLTITSDLFPRVCAPFQVSIEAVNALGASNVTSIVYNSITRSGLKGRIFNGYVASNKLLIAFKTRTPKDLRLLS